MSSPSRYERSLSRIPFDPRELRVVEGAARWMGVLGRFQVLAGGALLLAVLGAAIAYATTEAMMTEAVPSAEDTPPLVSLGEVTPEILALVGVIVAVVGVLVLRGGVLLTDAAEDLERVIHTDELDQHHLENALRRLRSYYRIELLLFVAVLGVALWWTVPTWLS